MPEQEVKVTAIATGNGYPYNDISWDPLTEWADKYVPILDEDLWSSYSRYYLVDVVDGQLKSRRMEGSPNLDALPAEDPDLRIFFCDSTLCADGVTRASFSAADIETICSKYSFSVRFLDFFVGRNRTDTQSRKLYSSGDPTVLTSYDYDSHVVLFTVYAHYDCRTQKSVLFYIHRLGSEQADFARKSSEKVKHRIRQSLEHILASRDKARLLKINPFAILMPTNSYAVTFWTDTMHTERVTMWKQEEEARKDLEQVDTVWLHSVARYNHSYKTNILFVQRVLEMVSEEHQWFARHAGTGYTTDSPDYMRVCDSLKSQLWQIKMSDRYADESVARSDILISLYFNKMSELNSRATRSIAASTRRDAGSMGVVAFLGMIFLPAAAMAAFFAMPFFPKMPLHLVWIYPLVSLFPTGLLVLAWILLDKRRRNRNDEEWQQEWTSLKIRHDNCSQPRSSTHTAVGSVFPPMYKMGTGLFAKRVPTSGGNASIFPNTR